MSQSGTAAAFVDRADPSTDATTVVSTEDTIQSLLNAVHTPDCRAILAATDDDALSASEIAERCDLPPSSVYRKLGLLTETGLLEERTRVRSSGHHTSEYVRVGGDLVVSIAHDGAIELTVRHRRPERRSSIATETGPSR